MMLVTAGGKRGGGGAGTGQACAVAVPIARVIGTP